MNSPDRETLANRFLQNTSGVITTGTPLVILLCGIVCVLHFLVPEYTWGQGRSSFFNLSNRLTLVSWMTSMALLLCGLLAVVLFLKQARHHAGSAASGPQWLLAAGVAFSLSFFEFTRLPIRLGIFEVSPFQTDDTLHVPQFLFGQGYFVFFGGLLLLWFSLFLRPQVVRGKGADPGKLRSSPNANDRCGRAAWIYFKIWQDSWIVTFIAVSIHLVPRDAEEDVVRSFLQHGSFLLGAVSLAATLGLLAAAGAGKAKPLQLSPRRSIPIPELSAVGRSLLYVGVAGTSFAMLLFEIVLFDLLTVFGDYLSANLAISIALLGIAIGGVVGFTWSRIAPGQAMAAAAVCFPLTLVLSFGPLYYVTSWPVLAPLLLTLPFALAGLVLAIALAVAPSHIVYFADLLGAGLAALLVNSMISSILEENTILVLAGAASLLPLCFLPILHRPRQKRLTILVVTAELVIMLMVISLNLSTSMLHLTRSKLLERYSMLDIVATRSCIVGRIDLVRRSPESNVLKLYENGRTIDTIRDMPAEYYTIDPRVPHTLIDRPDILIIGLSGEGITKTATELGGEVVGLEINPATLAMIENEAVEPSQDCYAGIDVQLVDGRTYLEQNQRQFDFITLMNAHFARGRAERKSGTPELLHTKEAYESYFEHLNNRGFIIFEEPANRPSADPPVVKMLYTMREMLIDQGVEDPARHFFVFQWTTKSNHYYQILLKKTPITGAEIESLHKWMQDCNDLKKLEAEAGHRLGPISSAHCVPLYTPGSEASGLFAEVIRGRLPDDYRARFKIQASTDDKPFVYDVDHRQRSLREAMRTTLVLVLLLMPFPALAVARHRGESESPLDLRSLSPYLLVPAFTAAGYLIFEMILIQRFEIFLGNPVISLACVLGTLLVSSGLGSLVVGRLSLGGAWASVVAALLLMLLLLQSTDLLFAVFAQQPQRVRIALSVLCIAPPGFFMGIPFPFILRASKTAFNPQAAALLYSISGIFGALTVPLALNLFPMFGYLGTSLAGGLAYGASLVMLMILKWQKYTALTTAVAAVILGCLFMTPFLAF